MEPTNRHPLESITGNSGLSLLELLIPFVEYPMKLPLALLIKFNEIRLIIQAFRSLENLTRLGLHTPSNRPLDMLCALTGIPPEMLQLLLSFSGNPNESLSPELLSALSHGSSMDLSGLSSILQGMQENSPTGQGTSTPASPFGAANTASAESTTNPEDFDRNIRNIFAEYDLQQAEQLGQKAAGSESQVQSQPSDQEVFL
ncbi:MAG: hypothetical protein IJ801_01720 [Lachnospiraceae bacterium]|nr:hypothetical protein [Lachnospiraceae bacterium]